MQVPSTFDDLIHEAYKNDLYKKLIHQLNKDFLLANINLDFNDEIEPASLKLILQETIYYLIQEKFTDYLNLLYITDVSEKKILQIDGTDLIILSEQVSFLILLREWQKVWYKNYY